MNIQQPPPRSRWLNRTVLGIGLASLFSDWSHEIATTVMPAFLATMGVAAAWLGLIEGVSDGLSSFAKMASGYYTDRLQRRKPIAVAGYLVTALGTASFGLATAAWHVLTARAVAWLGRGVRTPIRKALLAASVTKETYGRAFGFERMLDTLGAIVGPASAFFLLQAVILCVISTGEAATRHKVVRLEVVLAHDLFQRIDRATHRRRAPASIPYRDFLVDNPAKKMKRSLNVRICPRARPIRVPATREPKPSRAGRCAPRGRAVPPPPDWACPRRIAA